MASDRPYPSAPFGGSVMWTKVIIVSMASDRPYPSAPPLFLSACLRKDLPGVFAQPPRGSVKRAHRVSASLALEMGRSPCPMPACDVAHPSPGFQTPREGWALDLLDASWPSCQRAESATGSHLTPRGSPVKPPAPEFACLPGLAARASLPEMLRFLRSLRCRSGAGSAHETAPLLSFRYPVGH
jgi:hypothetical protein